MVPATPPEATSPDPEPAPGARPGAYRDSPPDGGVEGSLEAPPHRLAEATEAPPDPEADGAPDGHDDEPPEPRVLLAQVRGRPRAIPVEYAREVVRGARLVPVPGSAPVVRGLVNVRGRIVTVLVLDDTPVAACGAGRGPGMASFVLLEHDGRLLGLEVEAVRDVCAIGAGSVATTAAGAPVEWLDVPALFHRHLLPS